MIGFPPVRAIVAPDTWLASAVAGITHTGEGFGSIAALAPGGD